MKKRYCKCIQGRFFRAELVRRGAVRRHRVRKTFSFPSPINQKSCGLHAPSVPPSASHYSREKIKNFTNKSIVRSSYYKISRKGHPLTTPLDCIGTYYQLGMYIVVQWTSEAFQAKAVKKTTKMKSCSLAYS